MLTLLSPAKKLLQLTKPYEGDKTTPVFLDKTAALIDIMKTKSTADIAKLMDLSQPLAELNFQRYQHFSLTKDAERNS